MANHKISQNLNSVKISFAINSIQNDSKIKALQRTISSQFFLDMSQIVFVLDDNSI